MQHKNQQQALLRKLGEQKNLYENMETTNGNSSKPRGQFLARWHHGKSVAHASKTSALKSHPSISPTSNRKPQLVLPTSLCLLASNRCSRGAFSQDQMLFSLEETNGGGDSTEDFSLLKRCFLFALLSTGFIKGLGKQQRLISQRRAATYISATPPTCRKPQAVAT